MVVLPSLSPVWLLPPLHGLHLLQPAGVPPPLDRPEHELTGAVWLATEQEIQEGEFVDMIAQLYVSIGSHGIVGSLRQGGEGLVSVLPSVQEGGVEQLELLLKRVGSFDRNFGLRSNFGHLRV